MVIRNQTALPTTFKTERKDSMEGWSKSIIRKLLFLLTYVKTVFLLVDYNFKTNLLAPLPSRCHPFLHLYYTELQG